MSGPNISQTEFHRNHSWYGLFYSQTQVCCDWFSVYMSRLLVSEFYYISSLISRKGTPEGFTEFYPSIHQDGL